MNRSLIHNPLTLLLGAFMSVSVANAQGIDDNKVHFGFKIGLNTTGFTNDIGPLDKNTPGYATSTFAGSEKDLSLTLHAGITADYRISNSISIATEVLLNGRGGGYRIENNNVVLLDTAGNETTAYDKYIYDFWYLEMPLLIRYNLPSANPNVSYMVYGGVSPAINIASNAVYNYYTVADNGVDADLSSEVTTLSNARKFTVSPVIGFWSNQNIPGTSLGLFYDIRFEYTSSPVFSTAKVDGSNFETSMWTVNFGFRVRF